jgi:hypothetical protein
VSYGRGRGLKLREDLWHHLKETLFLEFAGKTLKQGEMPDSAVNSDLLPLIGGVGNQQTMGACAGYEIMHDAFGLAVAGQTGVVNVFSGLGGYTIGRMLMNKLDGIAASAPLTDEGSDPGTNILALQTFGPILEATWPSDPSQVNIAIDDLGVADKSVPMVPWTVGVYGPIGNLTGQALYNALCQALLPFADGKRGREFTLEVDASTDEFQNADGTQVLVGTNAATLDHSVGCIDYRTNSSGQKEWRLLNHWDPTQWGQNSDIPGTVWVGQQFIDTCIALGSTPRFIQAEPRVS